MISESKKKEITSQWFKKLQLEICKSFEKIEEDYRKENKLKSAGKFTRKTWRRNKKNTQGGGGTTAIMKGNVFEKVGVNVSVVKGKFSKKFRKEILGAEKKPEFWATGISVVTHMHSPLLPTIHFNTRYIITTKSWFGGGTDLTPSIYNANDKQLFHNKLKTVCDKYNKNYYKKYKKWCDNYFFLKHRNEMRGVGGIFFDYLNNKNWQKDFSFCQDLGKTFIEMYPLIIKKHIGKKWTKKEKEKQLLKRGKYVEFNLLYDRGTRFGLMTGGNTDAILMSLPPNVKWP